jgi:hypothetical protein
MRDAASLARIAILFAAVAMAAPSAQAQGSMGLDEVLTAVQGAPKLVSEIDVALRRNDLKVREIVCIAARHGNQWKHLGGGRAAPYECRIADRILKVEADRTYFDVNGKKLGLLGKATDTILFSRAKAFRETNLRWTWTQL